MIPGIQISSFRPLLSTPEGVAQVMAETARMGCTTVQLQWVDFPFRPRSSCGRWSAGGIRSGLHAGPLRGGAGRGWTISSG